MKRLLKIVLLGLGIWGVSLLWLELNRVLMSPLIFGLLLGTIPAYLFGHYLNRRSHGGDTGAARLPAETTRPVTLGSGRGASKPTQPMPARRRASQPTQPMPVMSR